MSCRRSTVFVFGAGVSIPAGLPPVTKLYEQLTNYWLGHNSCRPLSDQWAEFAQASAIDPENNFERFLTAWYLAMPQAPLELRDCFTEYFNSNHDRIKNDPQRLDYLNRFVSAHIRTGDVILTFNYDCLVECVLYQNNQWSISDGYGFPRQLSQNGRLMQNRPSPCIVLKMHGSAGWIASHPGLGTESLFYIQTEDLAFIGYDGPQDRAYERFVGQRPTQLPTYIKDFNVHPLPLIWRRAALALRRAKRIIFVGYSLPDSDSAAWMLFLSTIRSKQTVVFFWHEKDNSAEFRATQIQRRFLEAELNVSVRPCDIISFPSEL